MARAGITGPGNIAPGTITVAGTPRAYSLTPGPRPEAPLLVVLHGAGGTGAGMAALTGLARRAPGAGFAAVFPDGSGRVWNDQRGDAPRLARRAVIDDVGFIDALVAKLVADGIADPASVYAIGISNGSLLAEHIARHGLLPFAGIGLVAGPATVPSRDAMPRPARPATVVMFHGTADPLVPYGGGPIGMLGRLVQLRAGRPGRGGPTRGWRRTGSGPRRARRGRRRRLGRGERLQARTRRRVAPRARRRPVGHAAHVARAGPAAGRPVPHRGWRSHVAGRRAVPAGARRRTCRAPRRHRHHPRRVRAPGRLTQPSRHPPCTSGAARPAISGRSRYVRIPASASHT